MRRRRRARSARSARRCGRGADTANPGPGLGVYCSSHGCCRRAELDDPAFPALPGLAVRPAARPAVRLWPALRDRVRGLFARGSVAARRDAGLPAPAADPRPELAPLRRQRSCASTSTAATGSPTPCSRSGSRSRSSALFFVALRSPLLALDPVHALPDLEPVALHGPELRHRRDVPAPPRRRRDAAREALALRGVHPLVPARGDRLPPRGGRRLQPARLLGRVGHVPSDRHLARLRRRRAADRGRGLPRERRREHRTAAPDRALARLVARVRADADPGALVLAAVLGALLALADRPRAARRPGADCRLHDDDLRRLTGSSTSGSPLTTRARGAPGTAMPTTGRRRQRPASGSGRCPPC